MRTKTNKTATEMQVENLRYIEGQPKQYRFNAQSGRFNIDGITDVGNELTFVPLAYRFFTDALFNQERKLWCEIFFVDGWECLSCLMVNGTSAQELQALQKRLYYEHKDLTHVEIRMTSTLKTTEKGRWHLAQFQTK